MKNKPFPRTIHPRGDLWMRRPTYHETQASIPTFRIMGTGSEADDAAHVIGMFLLTPTEEDLGTKFVYLAQPGDSPTPSRFVATYKGRSWSITPEWREDAKEQKWILDCWIVESKPAAGRGSSS